MRHVKVLTIGVLALALSGGAFADTKVVQRNHTGELNVMGRQQPAQDREQTIWITDNKMRTDQNGQTVIVRLDQDKMFIVDHGEKTVTVLDLPFDIMNHVPEQMRPMIESMMNMDVSVKRTGETKKIGDWSTTKYEIAVDSQMMSMDQDAWATKDLGPEAAQFAEMAAKVMSLQPTMQSMAEEFAKIDGVVVLQEGTIGMMGASTDTRQEVISVEQSEPPAGTYDPPADYEQKQFDFQELMMKGR